MKRFATGQFPGDNPLGRAVQFAHEAVSYSIVGVVRNVKQISMREDPPRMAVATH